jgi:hypothetical protein
MAGCWLLLKNPTNRQVLGNAFSANPASTKLAKGMMEKLQATVDVADVNEAVSLLQDTCRKCSWCGVLCCLSISASIRAVTGCRGNVCCWTKPHSGPAMST